MDAHPLVVHFPIALLTLYSALEVIRYFASGARWVHTRTVLVVVGALGAFMSLATGEVAEHLYGNRDLHAVLEMHALSANVTTWTYAVLAAAYLLLWLRETPLFAFVPQAWVKPVASVMSVASTVAGPVLAPALAAVGFLGLLLTGALGAILVYGPHFDPVTSAVYRVLFGG